MAVAARTAAGQAATAAERGLDPRLSWREIAGRATVLIKNKGSQTARLLKYLNPFLCHN